MGVVAVLDALLGKTRQTILRLFVTRPDARLHLREVARQTGMSWGH